MQKVNLSEKLKAAAVSIGATVARIDDETLPQIQPA